MKKVSRAFLISLCILLIPAIATMVSEEVNWGIMDFFISFVLLTGVIFAIQWVYEKLPKRYRLGIIVIIILAFILLWAELAVGILGTPLAGD